MLALRRLVPNVKSLSVTLDQYNSRTKESKVYIRSRPFHPAQGTTHHIRTVSLRLTRPAPRSRPTNDNGEDPQSQIYKFSDCILISVCRSTPSLIYNMCTALTPPWRP